MILIGLRNGGINLSLSVVAKYPIIDTYRIIKKEVNYGRLTPEATRSVEYVLS